MEKNNSYAKGIFYILLSAFGFSVMSLSVNLAGELPVFEKAMFRNAFAMLFSLILFLRSGDKLNLEKENVKLLIVRSVLGTIGIYANFYAIDHLMLSDASMLNKLSPFFTLLLSAVILKEKTNWKQYLFIIIAFIGMLFIIKPSLEFSDNMLASLIGVLGGFAAGAAYTAVRALGKRGVPSTEIIFVFSAFSTVIGIPLVIMNHAPMSYKQILIMIVASLGATLGQVGITAAYKEAPSKKISIFDYFNVIFSALWGFLFLGQIPDIYSFVGYLIIFISAYLMFLYNRKH